MPSPKRSYPAEYKTQNFHSTSLTESFPFAISECGYCSERKFELGTRNNYNDYLLLYSLEGTARFTKSSETQYIQPNSVIITACNTSLTFTRVSKNWKFYYFIIHGSHAKLYYNLVRTKNNIILTNPFSDVLDSFIELYNIVCGTYGIQNDSWRCLHTTTLLHSIFTALYDLTYEINIIKEMTPAQETSVNAALKFISDNYMNELTIDTICDKVGFSKYYFCKLFKKQLGVTVHQYVNEFRINKAKELLAYTKLSITSISNQVGFKTTLTFLRAFERTVHMTPSEYRDYY